MERVKSAEFYNDLLRDVSLQIQKENNIISHPAESLVACDLPFEIRGIYKKTVHSSVFRDFYMRYSTFPNKRVVYNEVANDYEYNISMPIENFPNTFVGTFKNDKSAKWTIRYRYVDLKYFINQETLGYVVNYMIKVETDNDIVITVSQQAKVKSLNLYTALNQYLVRRGYGKYYQGQITSNKTYEIFKSDDYKTYGYRWLRDNGTSYNDVVSPTELFNYKTWNNTKFHLVSESKNSQDDSTYFIGKPIQKLPEYILTIRIIVIPNLSYGIHNIPQDHLANLKLSYGNDGPPELESFGYPIERTDSGGIKTFIVDSTSTADRLPQWEQIRNTNMTNIYWVRREDVSGVQVDKAFKWRTIPRTRPGFSSELKLVPSKPPMYTESAPKTLLDEHWILEGEFTLHFFNATYTRKTVATMLSRFEDAVIEGIPLFGLYMGKDAELLSMISKNSAPKLLSFAMTRIQRWWKGEERSKFMDIWEKNHAAIPPFDLIWWTQTQIDGLFSNFSSASNDIVDPLKTQLVTDETNPKIMNYLESVKKYLLETYFSMDDSIEIPLNQSLMKNGTYLIKWKRSGNDETKYIQSERGVLSDIEPTLYQIDYEYVYHFIPQNIKYVTILKTETMKFRGYVQTGYPSLRYLIAIRSEGIWTYFNWTETLKLAPDPADKNKIIISLPSRSGQSYQCPVLVSLVDRIPISYFERHYFQINEIASFNLYRQ